MVSILLDMDTGDPVIDPDTGLTVEVDAETAIKQIIYGVLNCQPGSEILNMYYGFDLESAIRLSDQSEAELFIETLLIDALDPMKERLISEVTYLRAVRDEDNPSRMNVNISITTITGETIEIESTLGD